MSITPLSENQWVSTCGISFDLEMKSATLENIPLSATLDEMSTQVSAAFSHKTPMVNFWLEKKKELTIIKLVVLSV